VSAMPIHRKPEPPRDVEPIRSKDAIFWLAIRQALSIIVKAIERRHLPDLQKGARQGAKH